MHKRERGEKSERGRGKGGSVSVKVVNMVMEWFLGKTQCPHAPPQYLVSDGGIGGIFLPLGD